MTCSNIFDMKNIPIYYEQLQGKKLFTNSLYNINTYNKQVHLLYYKKNNIPICSFPKLNLIVISKIGFLSFCYNFYIFINSFETKDIKITKENIDLIGKFALSHEVGHILDPTLSKIKSNYTEIVISIAKNIVKYNIDIKNSYYYEKNLPLELEDCIIQFKKNIILREINAWNIAKNIIDFKSSIEEYIFEKMKEYAIATYNFINLKNIVSEYNIENYITEFLL